MQVKAGEMASCSNPPRFLDRHDSARLQTGLLVFISLSMSVLGIWLSWLMLPIRTGDSFCFMPTIVNYANSRGLVNTGYIMWDPEGLGRLVWHGYLTSVLYGTLPWNCNYRGICLTQAFVAAGVLYLTVLLYLVWFNRFQRFRPVFLDYCMALMVIGLLPPLLTGRHEPLATVLLLLTSLGLTLLPKSYAVTVSTLGISLMAITSPAIGLLSSAAAIIYFSWRYPIRGALFRLIGVGVLTIVLTFTLTESIYPFGFQPWIKGLADCASRGLGYWDASSVQYWFMNPIAFMYGIWVAGAAIAVCYELCKNLRFAKWPVGVLGGVIVFSVLAWRLALWVPARNYNLFPSIPLACILILIAANNLSRGGYATPVKCVTLMIAMLPCVGTARMLVHCLLPSVHSLAYSNAQLLVDRELGTRGVLLDERLFTLVDSQEGYSYYHGQSGPAVQNAEVIIVGQAKSGLLHPPVIEGFKIVVDTFSRARPSFCGLPIANTPEGFNLAVYRRVR